MPSTPSVPYVPSVESVFYRTSDVRSRMLEPGSSISFRLTEQEGAALVTKYPTSREDVQLVGSFEKYTKEHYDSWVAFARGTGHGNNINPVLVTGADMTRDFAMMSYSTNDVNMASEFATSIPGVASPWGVWHVAGPIHTNCGPSSTQITASTSSGSSGPGIVPDEHNQCVFVRYYTMRKRLGVPKVIKAGAGARDLGPGGREDERLPLEAQSDSGSGSDIVSSLLSDGRGEGRSPATSIESESDIVIHNTAIVCSLPRPFVRSCQS